MGIYPTSKSNPNCSINWRNLSMLISFIQMLIFSLAYLVFKAETIIDAGTSFYATNTVSTCSIFLYVNFHKMPRILKLIATFKEFIENSRFLSASKYMRISSCFSHLFTGAEYSDTSTNYNELNENFEKISNVYHFLVAKCTFIAIFSATLSVTAINYFVHDLHDESYYLPFPVMYVVVPKKT